MGPPSTPLEPIFSKQLIKPIVDGKFLLIRLRRTALALPWPRKPVLSPMSLAAQKAMNRPPGASGWKTTIAPSNSLLIATSRKGAMLYCVPHINN
ncbi:MAG: hypothetical protein A2Y04_03130 [Omnitrophica WOR_2 bacterium GWC2_45_7]|nr:MAG: hypothetical protein A2Y04_03130 [Omnitrophica WOR_2 bacterium GWC2_45_7]